MEPMTISQPEQGATTHAHLYLRINATNALNDGRIQLAIDARSGELSQTFMTYLTPANVAKLAEYLVDAVAHHNVPKVCGSCGLGVDPIRDAVLSEQDLYICPECV